MNKVELKGGPGNTDEITFAYISARVRSVTKYLLSKWLTLIITGIAGGLLFLAYTIFQKPTYTATCTFVLEESGKGGMLSQYAGLASLAGVSLDNTESGLFQGDNILELYKSRLMIEKTLLSSADFDGKKELLIERYIAFNDLRNRWRSKDDIDNINFNGDPGNFNRKQDSIIIDLAKKFNKKYLGVGRPDKKLNIIQVDVSSKDELFAKNFAEKLVENVNNFYVTTKTKKLSQNVEILQKHADSVRNMINSSIAGAANSIDASPNANPALTSLRVPSQRKQVDVQTNIAVYGEVVKNLEVSRLSLLKETPLIQVIDTPILPLDNNRVSKAIALVAGFFTAIFLSALVLSVRKLLKGDFK
jgi:hypothetical protein